MEWYLKVLKQHYADFGGRARRQEYWMFTLFNCIVAFGIGLGTGVLGAMMDMPAISGLSMIYSLGVLVPSIAVAIRRLHDTGKSGWYMLAGLIPFIGGLYVLYLMCQDSAPGNNEYGPNPKGA